MYLVELVSFLHWAQTNVQNVQTKILMSMKVMIHVDVDIATSHFFLVLLYQKTVVGMF